MTTLKRRVILGTVPMVALSALLLAHPMTFKGTVASIEPNRMQIKTGEEKKGEAPPWLIINDRTKIWRDKTVVTFEQARIVVGERVVANVDHDADGVMKVVEIHLAAK
jgi:hypothetical protein